MLKRSRRSASVLAAVSVAAALLMTGCSAGDSGSDSGASATADRTVQTDQGKVRVPTDPQRVVVLNYALAGYLYDLDVPVVATTSEDFDKDEKFSEMWGDAPKKDGTEFVTWGVDGFDLEAILDYQPDLIVAGGLGFPNGLATDSYDQLSDIAPTVIVSKDLATWQDQFSFLAKDVFDRPQVYDDAVTAYDARVDDVKDAITVPASPVSVLTVTADGTPYLLFDDNDLPQTLTKLGFATAPLVKEHSLEPYSPGGDMAELSTEQAGQLLADVPGLFITGFNADTTDVATLKSQPLWSQLTAFQNDHAYDLPYWTVRGDYDESMKLLDIIEQKFS